MDKVYHNSHLTVEQVIAIKHALKTMPIPKVAKLFNLSTNKVSNMYYGITYRNVGE